MAIGQVAVWHKRWLLNRPRAWGDAVDRHTGENTGWANNPLASSPSTLPLSPIDDENLCFSEIESAGSPAA